MITNRWQAGLTPPRSCDVSSTAQLCCIHSLIKLMLDAHAFSAFVATVV